MISLSAACMCDVLACNMVLINFYVQENPVVVSAMKGPGGPGSGFGHERSSMIMVGGWSP